MLQVTSAVDQASNRIYSQPAFLTESVNFGAGFAAVGSENAEASSMSGAGAAGVVILVLLLIFGLLGFYMYVQNSKKGGVDLVTSAESAEDREAIDLAPLKKKIFEDSTEDTAGAPVLPQAEAGAEGAEGYWDYFAKERENQFFPGGAGAMPAYDANAPAGGYMANPYGAAGDSKAYVATANMPVQDADTMRTDKFNSAFNAQALTNSTIDAADIVARIDEMKATGVIEAEFAQIKQDAAAFDATFTAAGEDYNKRKNRYMNVRPIDATRVKLSHSGQLGGDYINANYVSGWQRAGAYIATQGPIQGTIHDFWRMVWEEKTGVIVMVTKLMEGNKLKCNQYWPDENGSIQAGVLEVLYNDYDDSDPDVTVRKMTLRSSMFNESREIIQYQVKSWPDQGVPASAAGFLQVLHTVRDAHSAASQRGQDGPVVTHCSAGIGRTGTFIAVDTTLRRLLAAGNMDMLSTVSHMRQERAGSVQTIAQYKFCYDAVKEYVVLNGVQPVARAPAPVVDDEELTAAELNQLRQLAGEDTGATDAQLFDQLVVLSQQ
jgi:protein tyrosine phosphatase